MGDMVMSILNFFLIPPAIYCVISSVFAESEIPQQRDMYNTPKEEISAISDRDRSGSEVFGSSILDRIHSFDYSKHPPILIKARDCVTKHGEKISFDIFSQNIEEESATKRTMTFPERIIYPDRIIYVVKKHGENKEVILAFFADQKTFCEITACDFWYDSVNNNVVFIVSYFIPIQSARWGFGFKTYLFSLDKIMDYPPNFKDVTRDKITHYSSDLKKFLFETWVNYWETSSYRRDDIVRIYKDDPSKIISDIEIEPREDGKLKVVCNKKNKLSVTYYFTCDIENSKFLENYVVEDKKERVEHSEIEKEMAKMKLVEENEELNKIFNECLLRLSPDKKSFQSGLENMLSGKNQVQSSDLSLVLLGCLAFGGDGYLRDKSLPLEKFLEIYGSCVERLDNRSPRRMLSEQLLSQWRGTGVYRNLQDNILGCHGGDNLLLPYYRFIFLNKLKTCRETADLPDAVLKEKFAGFVKSEAEDVLTGFSFNLLDTTLRKLSGEKLDGARKTDYDKARKLFRGQISSFGSFSAPDKKKPSYDKLAMLTRNATVEKLNRNLDTLAKIARSDEASDFAFALFMNLSDKIVDYLDDGDDFGLEKALVSHRLCLSKITLSSTGKVDLGGMLDECEPFIYQQHCTDLSLHVYFRSLILWRLSETMDEGRFNEDEKKLLSEFIPQEAKKILAQMPPSGIRLFLMAYAKNPLVTEDELMEEFSNFEKTFKKHD
jgi:hypothetical protein